MYLGPTFSQPNLLRLVNKIPVCTVWTNVYIHLQIASVNNFCTFSNFISDIYNVHIELSNEKCNYTWSPLELFLLILYMKTLLASDWLKAVQFKCNNSAKSATPDCANYMYMHTKITCTCTHSNSGLWLAERIGQFQRQWLQVRLRENFE